MASLGTPFYLYTHAQSGRVTTSLVSTAGPLTKEMAVGWLQAAPGY